ncbi:MAG: hypothetical protein U5P41_04835 [Gammaproteobacteria bacterium]|nr:hypothetical protein [Gammaproteobacteria bacterium]
MLASYEGIGDAARAYDPASPVGMANRAARVDLRKSARRRRRGAGGGGAGADRERGAAARRRPYDLDVREVVGAARISSHVPYGVRDLDALVVAEAVDDRPERLGVLEADASTMATLHGRAFARRRVADSVSRYLLVGLLGERLDVG